MIKNLAIKDLYTFSEQDLNTLYNFYKVSNIHDLVLKIYKKGMLIKDRSGIRSDEYESSVKMPYNPLDYYGTKQKKLGSGTFGKVYLYSGTSGTNAIKKMYLNPDQGYDNVILRELAILLRCQHPTIVPIIDIIPDFKKLYIVMPAADTDLRKYLTMHQAGGLDDSIRKSIAYQILDAFTYLASRDILHRDLKPQNILVYLNPNIRIEIADFGLAIPGGCINKTGMNTNVYTLWYRPLELLAEDSQIGYGTSADVWSIGCVLYELYTGNALFPGDGDTDMIIKIWKTLGNESEEQINDIKAIESARLDSMATMVKHKGNRLIIDTVRPTGGDQMISIILDCLKYDPNKRPSAKQLLSNPYFKASFSGEPEKRLQASPEDIAYVKPEKESKVSECENSFLLREWYPSNGILERKTNLSKERLEKKQNINNAALHILQDWLIEVWRMFKLTPRTFFATAFILDWVISKPEIKIKRDNLQLYGVTCSWIASKFCEIYAPEANDYVYISDKAYTTEQLIQTEAEILKVINSDLIFSVSHDFFRLELQPEVKINRKLIIHKLTLMALTFCDIRFDLLPHEQNTLGEIISNKLDDENYKVPDEYIENINKFKKQFFKVSEKYKALNKFALLAKNGEINFYKLLELNLFRDSLDLHI